MDIIVISIVYIEKLDCNFTIQFSENKTTVLSIWRSSDFLINLIVSPI